MKYTQTFESFTSGSLNEKLGLNSEEFRKHIVEIVAKKCPWAEVSSEEFFSEGGNGKSRTRDSIKFDNHESEEFKHGEYVQIYWEEGPANVSNSMIGIQARVERWIEEEKTFGWDRQDLAMKKLLTMLRKHSKNSPKNQ